MDIKNKNIVVTGAASGIGRVVTELLLQQGGCVVAADQNIQGMTEHTRLIPFQFDAADAKSVDALIEKARIELGGIDLFVANAGFAYYEHYDSADWGRIEAIFRVNVLSPLYVVGRMAELYPDGDYRVVVTGSAMGRLSMPGYAVYSSTKAALHGFAEGFFHEPKAKKRLALVYPIATKTKFFSSAGQSIPLAFPTQSAEAVAKAIVRGIQKDRNRIYPSFLFRVMLAIDRVCPPVLKIYLAIERRRFLRWYETSKKDSG